MDFQPPPGLTPFEVFFDSSEPNPGLPDDLKRFVGNLGFPPAFEDRPWVFSNFVQTLDGLVSFGGTRPGGEWVAQSRHDRWMMDLLRAHADALICGAQSLRLEAQSGRIPGGPVFRIVDEELLRLRRQVLGSGKLKNIVVTGSGRLDTSEYRLFQSERVEAWIATTPEGLRQLKNSDRTPVLVTGEGNQVDLHALLSALRAKHGIEHLLCEGGPQLYGSMARQGLIDEKFLTVSPQEIGAGLPVSLSSAEPEPTADSGLAVRPTSFTGPGLTVEGARWYRWISSRRAGDHEFNRYRIIPSGERTRSLPPAE
jgi:riboflavin biosynthesis pyrimidine reductase